MERVKVFIETVEKPNELEEALNSWLSAQRNQIEIVDVHQNILRQKRKLMVCMTIFYQERRRA